MPHDVNDLIPNSGMGQTSYREVEGDHVSVMNNQRFLIESNNLSIQDMIQKQKKEAIST